MHPNEYAAWKYLYVGWDIKRQAYKRKSSVFMVITDHLYMGNFCLNGGELVCLRFFKTVFCIENSRRIR